MKYRSFSKTMNTLRYTYLLQKNISKDMSVLNTKKCLRTKYDQTPKYDTSLDSAHRSEHFDITLDHFQPEPDHFWPTPDGSGRHRHVVHQWTRIIALNILIPHLTNYLK